MSLDTRARHAVRSLQESVVRVTPAPLPSVTRRHRASLVAGLIGALAIAFGSIALAAMLPDSTGDDAATVTSLVSDPEIPDGELVAMPEHGDDIEGIHQSNSTSTAAEPYTQFYGTAAPGTVVTAFSAFGAADTVVGESGEFHLKLFFEDPPSGVPFPVTLTVGDENHDFTFTWLWDPQNIEITAHQGYGESDSPEPFEKFFGSAPPGTEVTITSAYGSAETEAGDNGEWFKKVWFEGAPTGEAFPITVTVGDQVFEFEFLWTFDGSVEFALHQEGTVSDSESPYTRFVGTATPGTVIVATSAYGSADTVVGESGEFNFKVWFSGAPSGVQFPITVKVDGETYGTFYFTWYQGDGGSGEIVVEPLFSSTDSTPPYAKVEYWAPKNTKIQLISEYGSSSVYTTYTGGGHLKLYFSTLPPVGQPFTITIKVNNEVYDTFQFTSYSDGQIDTTVHQYNEGSESPEPTVKFYGTAPLGSHIEINSPYGSWSWNTENMEWNSGHLQFETLPPAGETFTITVSVNDVPFGPFQFTSWYEAVDVTVNHAFFTCDEPEPFDDLWGTASAGSTIKIISEYGTSEFTVGESGAWERRQHFTGAPYNTQFLVTVKVNGVVELTYYFTVLPPS